MRNEFKNTAAGEGSKVPWIKPALTQLKAGAAEINTGNVDDGDNGSAQNNS